MTRCGRTRFDTPIAFLGFLVLGITSTPFVCDGFATGPPRPRACPLNDLPLLTLDCVQPGGPDTPQTCEVAEPSNDLQTITTTTTTTTSSTTIPPASNRRRRLDENDSRFDDPTTTLTTGTVLYRTAVRPCACQANNYYDSYCPAGLNLCVLSSRDWQCQPFPTRLGDLARAVWPFACVMLVLLGSCLLGTSHGHQAMCCLGNRWYAAYLLRRRPVTARRMIRQWVRRRRPVLEARYRGLRQQQEGANGPTTRRLRRMEERMVQAAVAERGTRQPKRLLLSVRRYRRKGDEHRANDSSSSGIKAPGVVDEMSTAEDDDGMLGELGPTCTICYGPLQEGDRVGDLPCSHVFHTECLKVWLPRRNVCPLCLDGDIAKEDTSGLNPVPTITTSEEQFGSMVDSVSATGPPEGVATDFENRTRRSGSTDSGVLAQPLQNEESATEVAEARQHHDVERIYATDEPSSSELSV